MSGDSNYLPVSCQKETHPVITSLEELQAHIHHAFESDEVNIEAVQALMMAYKSNAQDWKKYAKFDSSTYTRNLVDEGNGKFNLILLCWGEGHGSSIHDHSDAHCVMKILKGSLREVRFDWPKEEAKEESGLNELSRTTMRTNQVYYMSDSLGLHRVENTSHTEGAVSLHLYCPPFSSCSKFDQRTGHRTTCQLTFNNRN